MSNTLNDDNGVRYSFAKHPCCDEVACKGDGEGIMHSYRAIGICFILLAIGTGSAAGDIITNGDIIATNGNEVGSGNGTLNLILFTESAGGASNVGGSFNGDDANTAIPTGNGNTTADVTYVTSIGELRDFYELNFPDGSGGSTVNQMAIFVDVNESGQVNDIVLDQLDICGTMMPTLIPRLMPATTPRGVT